VWALAPALLLPCAGAWRLARYNIDNAASSDFKGLPIPAAGLFVASLPLILFYNEFNIANILLNRWVLYAIIILLSGLMVSEKRFISMKFSSASVKNNVPIIILGLTAVISAILLQWLAVPLVFIFYIIISITTKKQIK
jgi:CDP-diacylglycerol--serine O-phosphatidyltransferase